MRSSFCRSTLNSPSWLDSRGGARRHPHPSIDVPRAGRRAPARLSTSADNSSGLTHTNSSPTNPGWFTVNARRPCGTHGRSGAESIGEPRGDRHREQDAAERSVHVQPPRADETRRAIVDQLDDGIEHTLYQSATRASTPPTPSNKSYGLGCSRLWTS